MNKKTLVIVAVIVVVGIAAAAAILRTPPATSTSAESADGRGPLDYPRGPHGARLLSDEALQVEMTIYEAGVPPQFRIYPYDASQKAIPPSEVNLVVELHRLGGRVDRITFTSEADYLRGNEVIEEPHSFDVKVSATRSGRQHTWAYSQIEGKVQLGADQIKSAGITINTVGPRDMTTTLELPGEVKADETRVARVVPRLQGVVEQVVKKEGDRVRKGEVIAVISSRELADAKRDYIAATHDSEYRVVLLKREEMLREKKISAEQDFLLAKKLADEALLAQRLAGQKLIVLGVPANTLSGLADASPETMARYEIRSPLDGVVVERTVTAGEAVAAEQNIFSLADLSAVWVDVSVYAKDLGTVKAGQRATIVSTDLGDRSCWTDQLRRTARWAGDTNGRRTDCPSKLGCPMAPWSVRHCSSRSRVDESSSRGRRRSHPDIPGLAGRVRQVWRLVRSPSAGVGTKRRSLGRDPVGPQAWRPIRVHQQLRREGRDRQARRHARPLRLVTSHA